MSRIIVKSLPKKLTEDRLREHFSSFGEITDLQLKYTKDGVFRQFAFIGFRDEEAAQAAIKQLNKSFIDTSKITVELYQDNAAPIKQQLEEKANAKKEQQLQKIKEKEQKKAKKIDPFESVKDDEQFAEFIKLQRNVGDKKALLWSDNVRADIDNDQVADDNNNIDGGEKKPSQSKSKQVKEKVLPAKKFDYTVKLTGLPYKAKRSALKKFFAPLKCASMRVPPNIKGIAFISFKNEEQLKQAMIKHRSFLDGHRIEIKLMESESGEKRSDQKSGKSKKDDPKSKTYELPNETIADSGRMFVRNLTYTCTQEDLEELFGKYGQIAELHFPIDRQTKKPKGFAFVTFTFPEHAVQAYQELDKTPFQGRLLHLIPAHAKPDGHQMGLKTGAASSFKSQKEQQEKADASKKPQTWNTLFLSSDAVANVLADRLNVNKRTIVADTNDSSESIAVRMALAETQLVNETRRFLIDNGVDLEAFENANAKRSKTIILVKNLQTGTTDDEIKTLFSRYGTVSKIVLPSYGTTAIVEMQERTEAKIAFEKLAYYSFKHQPIYLEWAPSNLISRKPKTTSIKSNEENDTQVKEQEEEHEHTDDDGTKKDHDTNEQKTTRSSNDSNNDTKEQIDENEKRKESETQQQHTPAINSVDGCTLFVKNINITTSDENFAAHFSKCGKLTSATIVRRMRDGSRQSLGYGFVVYQRPKSAQKALKQLQGSTLDDHCLQVSLSHAKTNQGKSSSTTQEVMATEKRTRKHDQMTSSANNVADHEPSTKLVVRNIPFEAKQQEVEKLFKSFGQLKAVRLPLKFGATQHRGFGFVEFITKNDAERAYEALSKSTHLYGRRLVLEWAATGNDVGGGDDQQTPRASKQRKLSH